MEHINQLKKWQEQLDKAEPGSPADMDVAARLVRHGIEALTKIDGLTEGLKIASACACDFTVTRHPCGSEDFHCGCTQMMVVVNARNFAGAITPNSEIVQALLGALDDDSGGGLPDVDAWIESAATVLRGLTPNV